MLDWKLPSCAQNAKIQPRDVMGEGKSHFSEEKGQGMEEEINLGGGSQMEPMNTQLSKLIMEEFMMCTSDKSTR